MSTIQDAISARLGEHPSSQEVAAAIRALSTTGAWSDDQRLEGLVPLAVRDGRSDPIFFLARWLRGCDPLVVEKALELLVPLVPEHPDSARLLLGTLLLGDALAINAALHQAVQRGLERWPTDPAFAHVANNHSPNEAVARQLDSGDSEQVTHALIIAADECSCLPAIGVDVFAAFGDEPVPDDVQLAFVELLCKYERFDPPMSDEERCETLVEFALGRANAKARADIAGWFRTSEDSWVRHAVAFIGRRGLDGDREIHSARKLLASLASSSSPVANRVAQLVVEWPSDPSLSRMIKPLASDLVLSVVRAGDTSHLKALLAHGPNIDSPFDDDGFNALHHAVQAGDESLVRTLLDAGANTEVPAQSFTLHRGHTALQLAALAGREAVVEVLLQHGARVDVVDTENNHRSLCHLAAIGGSKTLLGKLLAAGQDLEISDDAGLRPLHAAAMHGNVEAARSLIEGGAEVNVQGALGKTPLHYAAEAGWAEVVELLIESSANLYVRDHDGELPGDVARTVAVQRRLGEAAAALEGDPVRQWLREAITFYRGLSFFRKQEDLAVDDLIDRLQDQHGPINSGTRDADLGLIILDDTRVWESNYHRANISHPVTAEARCYQGAIASLQKISRGLISFDDLEERWDSDKGPIKVTFSSAGRQHELAPEYLGSYFDIGLLEHLNHAVAASGVSHRFVLYHAHQMDLWGVCVLFLDEAEQQRMETERGRRFYRRDELATERAKLRALAADDM